MRAKKVKNEVKNDTPLAPQSVNENYELYKDLVNKNGNMDCYLVSFFVIEILLELERFES